jgi:LysM repeat protein
MMKINKMIIGGVAAVCCAAALLAGCGPAGGKDAVHPYFVKAERARAIGNYPVAVEQLRRFLGVRPESAAGHLALASVFDENLDEPGLAIYHYREFLRLAPDSPDVQPVQVWLRAAEVKYRDQLNLLDAPETASGAPPASGDFERLRRQNEMLKRQLLQKQREIVQLQQNVAAAVTTVVTSPAPAPAPAPAPPAAVKAAPKSAPPPAVRPPAVYRVQSGDTLGSIARKFYGSSARYKLIMEANGLGPASVLNIGQELKIPPASQGGENQ